MMSKSQRGFSLVEVLISMLILLVVMLAILPLFTRSIAANAAGFDYTEVSNAARSRAEQFLQYGFNSEPLTITAGNERTYTDVYSNNLEVWIPEEDLATDDVALLTRDTVIRQFGINDLETPLPAGTPPAAIHLKEVAVDVTALDSVVTLGPGKTIGLRVFKSQ